jgi:WD40 repeat protein
MLTDLDFLGDDPRIVFVGTWMRYHRSPKTGTSIIGRRTPSFAGSLVRVYDYDHMGDEILRYATANWIRHIIASRDGKKIIGFDTGSRCFQIDLNIERVISVRPDIELDATQIIPKEIGFNSHKDIVAASDNGLIAISSHARKNEQLISGLIIFDFSDNKCRFLTAEELLRNVETHVDKKNADVLFITSFALSGDGKSVVVASSKDSKHLFVIDLESLNIIRRMEFAEKAMVKQIVIDHGGRIAVVDSENGLTVFTKDGRLIVPRHTFDSQSIVGTLRFVDDKLILITGGVPASMIPLAEMGLDEHRLRIRRIRVD